MSTSSQTWLVTLAGFALVGVLGLLYRVDTHCTGISTALADKTPVDVNNLGFRVPSVSTDNITSSIERVQSNIPPQTIGRHLPHDGKTVAVMVTITHDMAILDGAAILYESILEMHSRYNIEAVAIVHSNITTSRKPLEKIGYKVIERTCPIDMENIPQIYIDEGKAGCCGVLEFLKLEALALEQYHRVVAVDLDALFLRNIDELFEEDAVLLYTTDNYTDPAAEGEPPYNIIPPVQGGLLIFKPNKTAYSDLVAIAKKADWRPGTGWEGLKIGYHWGGVTIQGILPYYFGTKAPQGWWKQIDNCVYNNMNTDNCQINSQALEDIKTIHFTSCQKPWECFWEIHKKQFHTAYCEYFQSQWWHMRDVFQRRIGKFTPVPLDRRCLNEKGTKQYKPLQELV
eukprot:m.97848 g.97848  ORF g.97848 m.97848 type:complete len:399 (+) comp27015_c0_seq1:273-1469(+)